MVSKNGYPGVIDRRMCLQAAAKLVKLKEECSCGSSSSDTGSSSKYKELYRVGLRAKMTAKVETEITTSDPVLDATVLRLLSLHQVLLEIQKHLSAS
jgi:hypothetical protein